MPDVDIPALTEIIKKEIAENEVVLFMKGTKDMPMCGFSAVVVQIFNKLGVAYKDMNVFEPQGLGLALKEYSEWPTFPQVFVKGELIGGCDITREMFESGELQQLLKDNNIAFAA